MGRESELIVSGGFNIYPRDIEEVLYEHPKVKEAVCFGVPDPYRGQTVKVAIVLKEGESATEEEIIEFCRPRLARYKIPKLIEFRDSLPKTPTHRIEKYKLRSENKDLTKGCFDREKMGIEIK